MICLVKHLSKTYDIVVSAAEDLPINDTYSIARHDDHVDYLRGDKLFANILTVPSVVSSLEDNAIRQIATQLYSINQDLILTDNKYKFIIAAVSLKNDGSKDVVHISSYINLIKDSTEYNKLPENSPMHHYEVYNYHSSLFEMYIKKEDAIKKLISYMDAFVVEYKSNIIKEFLTKEEFLEYITDNA